MNMIASYENGIRALEGVFEGGLCLDTMRAETCEQISHSFTLATPYVTSAGRRQYSRAWTLTR